MTAEQHAAITAEIIERLELILADEWCSFWYAGMVRRLEGEDVDWKDAALWALIGLSRLTGDAVVLHRRLIQLEGGRAVDEQDAHRHTLPATIPATPEREVQVTNPTGRKILYVMGKAGIGRKWVLARRVAELAGVSAGTLNNAFTKLARGGLIAPYRYRGEVVKYRYGRGGRKRGLYVLTDDGRLWYQHNYGEAATSELETMVPRHGGVQHAVDILEARDLLRGLALRVDDDPKAMTLSGDEWGPRAEPDLVMRYAGQVWPVEVQREIRTRNNKKWEKTLELSRGYLMLILESEGERRSQIEILRRAGLPGTILVTSLERLREGEGPQDWDCMESGQ
jgi:hypothetical protein